MRHARLISTIAVLLIAWTIAGAEEGGPRVVPKPKPPLSVSIEPVQESEIAATAPSGQAVELRIVVHSLIDQPVINISVSTSGGAEIIAGETSWSGPLSLNAKRAWNISVRASPKGAGKITVRAEEGVGGKGSFRSEVVYELGKSPGKKPEAGSRVKDRQGRDVIEYEVK
jgi:hypothetical protein